MTLLSHPSNLFHRQFDLPPSRIAKPLPVRDQQPKPKDGKKPPETKKANGPSNSRRKSALDNDTPKAFQRLMQYRTTGKRAPSGLETGDKPRDNKKRKRTKTGDDGESQNEITQPEAQASSAKAKQAMPKILPGEKLSDFSARVDRTLPLSEMKKSTGGAKVKDHKMTKHEKHLRRLQAGWREEEAKIREREEAERDERAADMEEELELLKKWEEELRSGKAKKKGTIPKKKKSSGDADGDNDPDPWAKLKKRDKERQANPFDFAQAPPELAKPREIFKVRGGAKVDVANVPNSVGSLRRREELADERRNIVDEYRRLMAEKRGEL